MQSSLNLKFQLEIIIWIFWTKFAQKRYLRSKNKKLASLFLLIQISLNAKFGLELTTLIVWNRFNKKGCF